MVYSFGRNDRVLKADEFSSVFALRRSKHVSYFQILTAPNAAGHARLGLIVAKKIARKAHERNYMKRTIREWFRLHKSDLPACDFVVRAKLKYEHDDYALAMAALRECMDKQLCQKY